MTGPKIEIEIADILKDMQSKQDRIFADMQSKQEKILEEIKELKIGQTKLEGRIETLDKKLSGQIETLDEKLSGQIKTLDAKVEQIDKRVAYQEFINRGVLIGLILALLGGAAKIFGFGVNFSN